MKMSSNVLFDTFNSTAELVSHYPAMAEVFEPVAIQFADKQRQPDASIMVYGVYNAGKSTLINALVGKNVAATGDIPLTDRVDEYRWGQYAILDTPGVDAPQAHEQVTRDQMLKADAIIFVVNPSGAAEELKTLQVLIDLLAEGKKLFLVFNEKDTLSLEDFTRLKNDTRIRLQALAATRGMCDVLADIPIWRVNALSALIGKLKQKQGLIEDSGYPAFETALTTFVESITTDDVSDRLTRQLRGFLEHFIAVLMRNAGSESVRQYDTLLRNLVVAQGNCRREIKKEISNNRTSIYERSKMALRQDPQQSQSKIEDFYQNASDNVKRVLNDEMEFLANQFNDDIETLEAVLSRSATDNGVQVNCLKEGSDDVAVTDISGAPSRINADMVNQAVNVVGKMAKPEHVVEGLKLVKEWIPSIMKGIGPKTMEKWGSLLVGKWIPYIGPAVTVLSTVWDMFADDPEEKKLRQQSEQYQRERERFMQEVEDIAQNIATQYETAMTSLITEVLEPWFSEMKKKVTDTLNTANQRELANRSAITEAQQLLRKVRTSP